MLFSPRLIFLLALIIVIPRAANADCTSPDGPTAKIIYNTTHNVFQGCCADGKWVALSGGGGATFGAMADITPNVDHVADRAGLIVGTRVTNNGVCGLSAFVDGILLSRTQAGGLGATGQAGAITVPVAAGSTYRVELTDNNPPQSCRDVSIKWVPLG